ncbi:MAG TPA: ATP-binding protein [Hyphomicrobiaceae bacterium]|nr:ATP-binding protein [Hyphomicrobiaceae bacterium]
MPSRPERTPDLNRDLGHEFERFVAIGDRLERKLEELKDLQWQIRENEARYRDLLDNQADVILRRDAEGRLTFVNQAFCRVFGRERAAVLGQPFRPRVFAGDEACPLAPGAAIRHQRYVQEIETAAGPRWFEWEEHAVPASEGAAAEVQSLGRDITEARRVQAQLTDAHRQAEAANRAKSRFLAAMSHEIRTPMNGILGMTGLLGETELSAEQQTYARAIDRSARTLLSLIDEILDFSKIEADKLVLKSEQLSIEDSVQGVVELLAPKAYEKGIDIAWAVDPAVPRVLLGDEVRLRQIVTNLVGNAIKFTDSGGVLVTVGRLAGTSKPLIGDEVAVAITVEDSGIGIAPDALPFLFHEFEQAEAAVRRRLGGTGLGLAISRRLAQAMAGDIFVASEPGKGSTFTAVVRLRRDRSQAMPPTPAMPVGRHVMLALDRPIERRALGLALEGAGVPVEDGTLASAGALIDAAAAAGEPFTTILVDGSSDREQAARLIVRAREAAPGGNVQGIVVLDTSAKAAFPELQSAGFDAYLVRPVRPQSLLACIETGFADTREPAAAAAPQRGRQPRTGKMISVLLVEDNDINALLARCLLEKAGCEVRTCVNGREAVGAFRCILAGSDAPVDLVLMDLHMPVLDGLEAARAIRQLYASRALKCPPIVAVTANAFDEDRRQCLDAGMDDYLTKPFDREDVSRLLERWCGDKGDARAA